MNAPRLSALADCLFPLFLIDCLNGQVQHEYQCAGSPFGASRQRALVWMYFGTFTTAN